MEGTYREDSDATHGARGSQILWVRPGRPDDEMLKLLRSTDR